MRRLYLPSIVVLGLLLLLPNLFMGFYADDYVHQLVLRGGEELAPMKPWSLFDFGTLEDWSALDGRVGTSPWWTGEGWKVRFLRPVASLALWGQHALFGGHALGYHAVGLLLFAVLLVCVHGLYRILGLSDSGARTATLLLALCDSVELPAGWIANQSTLLVAILAVVSLRAALGGTAGPGRVVVALSAAVLAALAKEGGSMCLPLVAAALAWRARHAHDERARRLALAGAAAASLFLVAYATLLVAGGYGTHSLFYATPWSDPVRFARNLLVLAAAGPLSLAGPFPLDVCALFPGTWPFVALAGGLVSIPLAIWIGRSVRGSPGAGWLLAWTVLFGVVQAGAPPSDRLLFVPAIGGLGLLALFLEERRRARRGGADGRWARLATRALRTSATVGSGSFLLVQALGMGESARYLRERALESDVGSPELGHRDVIVLQAESQMQAFTLHATWAFESTDHDLSFWNLQGANRPVRWTRTAPDAFELETLAEPFLTLAFESVYLSGPPRFEVGRRWSTEAFSVEALAVEGGAPTKLLFRFTRSLEDPAIRFVHPVEGRLTRIEPPPVGGSVVLERPVRAGPWIP